MFSFVVRIKLHPLVLPCPFQVVAMRNQMSHLNSSIADDTSAIKSDVTELKHDVTTLSEQTDALTSHVEAMTSNVRTVTSDVRAVTSQVGTLTSDVGVMASEMRALSLDAGFVAGNMTRVVRDAVVDGITDVGCSAAGEFCIGSNRCLISLLWIPLPVHSRTRAPAHRHRIQNPFFFFCQFMNLSLHFTRIRNRTTVLFWLQFYLTQLLFQKGFCAGHEETDSWTSRFTILVQTSHSNSCGVSGPQETWSVDQDQDSQAESESEANQEEEEFRFRGECCFAVGGVLVFDHLSIPFCLRKRERKEKGTECSEMRENQSREN